MILLAEPLRSFTCFSSGSNIIKAYPTVDGEGS